MTLKLPPNFDLSTFTKREENPIKIRVSDVEEHVRKATEKIEAPEILPFVNVLRETLTEVRQILGDGPIDPDEFQMGTVFEQAFSTALAKTDQQFTSAMEFETMHNITHFIARETSRQILTDLLGEDPFERLKRMEQDQDPELKEFAHTMDVLEANVRREYWFP